MAISNNFTGFFGGLSFTGNINRMRKALVAFLTDEGVKSKVEEGSVVFEYNKGYYMVDFETHGRYAEACITFKIGDEDYESLSQNDKTFIADKVNTDLQNHATVYAFGDTVDVQTMFYFTSKRMMMELFVKHFEKMNSAVMATFEILADMIESSACKAVDNKPKRIGFCVPDSEEQEAVAISAKKV